jgi:hypothetical protein
VTRIWLRRGLLGDCDCCGKQFTFYTRGDAERFLRFGRHRADFDPRRLVAYHCPRGAGFRLGHASWRTGYGYI